MTAAALALSRADIVRIDPGVIVLAASWTLALAAAFVLRRRVSTPVVVVALAVAGVGLGWGGMMLRDDPHAAELAAAVALLAVLVPAHVRIVLGPLGRRPDAP